jgi:hypothetical protein
LRYREGLPHALIYDMHEFWFERMHGYAVYVCVCVFVGVYVCLCILWAHVSRYFMFDLWVRIYVLWTHAWIHCVSVVIVDSYTSIVEVCMGTLCVCLCVCVCVCVCCERRN